MNVSQFQLPKKTGTYADALAAIGLGRLLYRLSGDHPTVREDGSGYVAAWSGEEHDLDLLAYAAVHADPAYPYVLLKPPDAAAPNGGTIIDYGKEREKLLAWRERRKEIDKARGGRRTPEDEETLKDIEPMKAWYLYQNLNVLQGFNSYNSLHHAIRASNPTDFATAVRRKLEALAEGRDLAGVATPFAPKVAAVQAFNPVVGKGINRPKPDGPALAGLPNAYVDWFEEWLRYIGINLTANALNVGDDIKFVVITPADLDEGLIGEIRDEFVSLRLAWSSAKIDVLGALGLVRVLITRSNLMSPVDDELFTRGRQPTPRDIIAGLQTAYFTSLGSAKALTNTSFIALPGWFPIELAGDWLSILAEHENVLRARQ